MESPDPDEDPASSVARELSPDERLLWAGRPRQGVFFLRAGDAFAIPLTALWCGVTAAVGPKMLSILSDDRTPWPQRMSLPLGGALLMLMGLYMMIGRFFVDSLQREKTVYAVTNKRVIIRSGLFKQTTDSLGLRVLPNVALSRHLGGRGTIIFGPADSETFFGDFGGWPGFRNRLNPPRFESIAEATRVYEIIRAAQGSAF